MHRSFRASMRPGALASLLLACQATPLAPVAAGQPAGQPAPAGQAVNGDKPATAGPAAVVDAKASPAPKTTPSRGAERPAKRSIDAAETAALAAYAAEMQVGRTQTRAKAYSEAIAAFDRALVQQPNSPRALAERGYAKLLAKDLEGARSDLEGARQRTQDPARLGPIWFNVGLVAEASGNPEGALRAFTLANELKPSKAAAARLAGKLVCTAEIERQPKPGAGFASWKALYDHLRADTEEPPLTRDSELHEALCYDPKQDTDKLWDLCFYDAMSIGVNGHASLLVGQAPDEQLVLFEEIGYAGTGSCQGFGKLTVTPIGGLLHARYVEFGVDWAGVPIDPAVTKPEACAGEAEIAEGCELECIAVSATVDDYVVDLAGKQRLLRVRRTTNKITSEDPQAVEAALPIDVTVTAEGVTLKGGGCDETVPLRPPAP